MNTSKQYQPPSLWNRIFSVWYRHIRVYNSDFLSNAFPPFVEPLIFLAGLGLGIGSFIQTMGNMPYIVFLASGLLVTSAMFSASYECTYGTFIRLEFDKVYDGMLGAPISPWNLVVGEILFAGTKGFFFSLAVLVVIWATGIIRYPWSILATLVGFITGIMFAALSMVVTALTKNINHFNFYFSGLISPMFFFSGVVFPLENLPGSLQVLAEVLPLTHVVRMARAFCVPVGLSNGLWWDLLYCLVFTLLTGWFAVRRLKRRMIV